MLTFTFTLFSRHPLPEGYCGFYPKHTLMLVQISQGYTIEVKPC